jgi:hypothetical protein
MRYPINNPRFERAAIASAFAVAALMFSALAIHLVPAASAVANAGPNVQAQPENVLPDYFPDRFRDVTVWDDRPQPETF